MAGGEQQAVKPPQSWPARSTRSSPSASSSAIRSRTKTSGSTGPGGASVQPKPRRSGTINRRVAGQPLDHAAPLVPVLRPAVDEQQRLAGTGLGDVHAQPARLDEAVLDPVDRREVVPHAAASIRPMTSAAPRLESGSLRLPHFGDCTHDGQPLSHGHSQIRRCASSTSASKAR